MATINNNGISNVLPGGILSDGFRPGNQELSTDFFGFAEKFNIQIDSLDSHIYNSQGAQDFWTNNTNLNVDLSNLTNIAISANTYINIDPVVLDLNGDGVKLTSYNDSEVTFDVDNDGKQERTGWVSSEDGILVEDQNGDGIINNITETISEYYKLQGSNWVAGCSF